MPVIGLKKQNLIKTSKDIKNKTLTNCNTF